MSLVFIIRTLVRTDRFFQWIPCILVNHSASLSKGLGGMSIGNQISTTASSSFISSVNPTLLLQEPECFFIDEPGRPVHILILGMTRTTSVSNPICTYSGTYHEASSIINVRNIALMAYPMSGVSLGFIITIHV